MNHKLIYARSIIGPSNPNMLEDVVFKIVPTVANRPAVGTILQRSCKDNPGPILELLAGMLVDLSAYITIRQATLLGSVLVTRRLLLYEPIDHIEAGGAEELVELLVQEVNRLLEPLDLILGPYGDPRIYGYIVLDLVPGYPSGPYGPGKPNRGQGKAIRDLSPKS